MPLNTSQGVVVKSTRELRLKESMPELEASYAVQSLYLDVYCEKRAEIETRLTR